MGLLINHARRTAMVSQHINSPTLDCWFKCWLPCFRLSSLLMYLGRQGRVVPQPSPALTVKALWRVRLLMENMHALSLSLPSLSAFQTSKSFKEEESSAREERGQCICSPSSLSVWGALEVAMFFRLPHITLCWPLLEVPTLIGSWHRILLCAP